MSQDVEPCTFRLGNLLRDYRSWLAAGMLAVSVTAAFWPCLDNEFTRGDGSPVSSSRHRFEYPPLASLFLAGEHALWASDPRGYHAVSLGLHGISTILVFLLTAVLAATARRATRSAWPELLGALLAALLFGLHPLRVEVVAWAAQCGLQISVAFLLLWALFQQGTPRAKQYAPLLYFVALAASPVGVSLPLVLLVLDWYFRRRVGQTPTLPSRGLTIVGYFMVAAAALLLSAPTEPPATRAPNWIEHMALGAWNAVDFVWQTAWPERLLPLHELVLPLDLGSVQYLGSLAAAAAGLVIATVCIRRLPGITAGLVAYLLFSLPAAALLSDGREESADRFTYLPAVILAAWAGCSLARLAAARDDTRRVWAGLLMLGGVVAAGVLGTAAWRQCYVWRTPLTLWEYAVEQEPLEGPHSGRVRFELARASAAVGQTERAIQHYQAATSLRPDLLAARFGLADMLLEMLRGEEALEVLRAAVTLVPQSAEAHLRLGAALAMCGQLSDAEPEIRRAIDLDPSGAAAHAALGHLLLMEGRAVEAITEFRAAVDLNAGDAELSFDLGRAYLAAGQRERAKAALQRALELNPKHRLARKTLDELSDRYRSKGAQED